ncbi:MAG TPA: hypothetical protein VKF36_07140 [Syntrophorhabdales bacterium]|nr:hypothetical protein [Syntrophorhabdales bacterium]
MPQNFRCGHPHGVAVHHLVDDAFLDAEGFFGLNDKGNKSEQSDDG